MSLSRKKRKTLRKFSPNRQSGRSHHVRRAAYDKVFLGNCFCYDGCVWAPLNPRPYGRQRWVVTSRPFKTQLKSTMFFCITLVVISAINCSYLYFDSAFLMKRVGIPVTVVFELIFAVVILSLFATAGTDPGILIPATDDEASYFMDVESKFLRINLLCAYTFSSLGVPRFVPGRQVKSKLLSVIGQPVSTKWCYTCGFFRPPRAVHCGICNACIDTMDHHCPWIGNCVGRRNYRSFFLFICSLSAYCSYAGGCFLAHIFLGTFLPFFQMINWFFSASTTDLFISGVRQAPATTVELVLILITSWGLFGLAGMHCFFVVANLTTNEYLKNTFVSLAANGSNIDESRQIENPYTLSTAFRNCQWVLCSSRPPTQLRKVPH